MITIQVAASHLTALQRRAIEQRISEELRSRGVDEEVLTLYASGLDSDEVFGAVSTGVYAITKKRELENLMVSVNVKGN